MHDPLTVAFEIKLPIPRLTSWGRPPEGNHRFTIQRRRYKPVMEEDQHYMNKPIYPWYRPQAWELWVAGKKVRMRTFCTVWHVEPFGHDSGEVCSHWKVDKKTGKKIRDAQGHFVVDNSWRCHVHHFHYQFPWLQEIKRWLFTKCSWCGGPSRRGDYVNCGYMNGSEVYHNDCMTPEHAWRSCSCVFPLLPVQRDPRTGGIFGIRDYGTCDRCGRFHKWRMSTAEKDVYAYIRENVPHRTRMPAHVKEEVHRRWAEIRQQEEGTK